MIAIDIFDAGLLTAMLVALAGGILSFASPCVLPVVPAYLAYMSGTTFSELEKEGRRRETTITALYFVLGLSTIFVLLGLAASAIGSVFLSNQQLFGRLAGCVVIVFGLHFLGIFRIPLLDREVRFGSSRRGGTAAGAYVLGLAFAFGWVPCIGPVLGAILALAAQESSVARGTILLAVYAMGLGIPFLLCGAYLGGSVRIMRRLKPHLAYMEKGIGLLLTAIGLLLLTGRFSDISYWVLEIAPWTAFIG